MHCMHHIPCMLADTSDPGRCVSAAHKGVASQPGRLVSLLHVACPQAMLVNETCQPCCTGKTFPLEDVRLAAAESVKQGRGGKVFLAG